MKKLLFALIISLPLFQTAMATHLRAGQITVKQQPGSLTCLITVTVYTNTGTSVLFGGREGEEDFLDFGDGQSMLVPETLNTYRPDLGYSIGSATFEILHTFPSYGSFVISYREPNRNEGILNFNNSVNTRFYTETLITLREGELYETPTLLMDPILKGNTGFNYAESLACSDPNNYELYYHLIPPRDNKYEDVPNYVFPENISLDPISGLLTWDAKFKGLDFLGEFAFAVRIYQVKNNEIVGYMVRDFQLILTNEMTEEPSLEGGEQSNGRIFAADNSTTHLKVEAGSNVTDDIELQIGSELGHFPGNFSYTVEDSVHEDTNFKVAKIYITNNDAIIRDTPYIIVARAVFDKTVKKDLTYVVATKDVYFEEPLILAAEGEASARMLVAPNPVTDFLKIENKENLAVDVKIYDLSGKAMIAQTLVTTSLMDLRSLTAGTYICWLTTKNRRTIYRIVKE